MRSDKEKRIVELKNWFSDYGYKFGALHGLKFGEVVKVAVDHNVKVAVDHFYNPLGELLKLTQDLADAGDTTRAEGLGKLRRAVIATETVAIAADASEAADTSHVEALTAYHKLSEFIKLMGFDLTPAQSEHVSDMVALHQSPGGMPKIDAESRRFSTITEWPLGSIFQEVADNPVMFDPASPGGDWSATTYVIFDELCSVKVRSAAPYGVFNKPYFNIHVGCPTDHPTLVEYINKGGCPFYQSQKYGNGEGKCTHSSNPSDTEGNCNPDQCPTQRPFLQSEDDHRHDGLIQQMEHEVFYTCYQFKSESSVSEVIQDLKALEAAGRVIKLDNLYALAPVSINKDG